MDWADTKAREWLTQLWPSHESQDVWEVSLAALLREVAVDPEASPIYDDFCKCYDLAMLSESYWPATVHPVGTVSERLKRALTMEHEAREAVESKLAEVRRMVQGVQDQAKKDWGGGGDRWAEVKLYTDEILSRLEALK